MTKKQIRKPRTKAQRDRRKERDAERGAERKADDLTIGEVLDADAVAPDPDRTNPNQASQSVAQARPPVEPPDEPIPPLQVQRMGKLWRIVYVETRNLARFNSGDAVDQGGFKDEMEARIYLAQVTSGQTTSDPEEERVE